MVFECQLIIYIIIISYILRHIPLLIEVDYKNKIFMSDYINSAISHRTKKLNSE